MNVEPDKKLNVKNHEDKLEKSSCRSTKRLFQFYGIRIKFSCLIPPFMILFILLPPPARLRGKSQSPRRGRAYRGGGGNPRGGGGGDSDGKPQFSR
jgi:hypothetical protein